MKPIIFLDVDGVLNSERFYRTRHARGLPWEDGSSDLCPEAIANLNRLISETDAHVVVSSTWRLFHKDIDAILATAGVNLEGRFLGVTPSLSDFTGVIHTTVPRGREIRTWLKQNDAMDRPIVILDDDADMELLRAHLIQTDARHGLTAEDVNKALALLAL